MHMPDSLPPAFSFAPEWAEQVETEWNNLTEAQRPTYVEYEESFRDGKELARALAILEHPNRRLTDAARRDAVEHVERGRLDWRIRQFQAREH